MLPHLRYRLRLGLLHVRQFLVRIQCIAGPLVRGLLTVYLVMALIGSVIALTYLFGPRIAGRISTSVRKGTNEIVPAMTAVFGQGDLPKLIIASNLPVECPDLRLPITNHMVQGLMRVVIGCDLRDPEGILAMVVRDRGRVVPATVEIQVQESSKGNQKETGVNRTVEDRDVLGEGAAGAGVSANNVAGDIPASIRFGSPLVGIYHTHASELYCGSGGTGGGVYHVFNSFNTGVLNVGRRLAEGLRMKGIPVIHMKTLHDSDKWERAYIRSAHTAREMVRRYPSIKLLLDIHRDGVKGVNMTTEINGQKAARVLIIVTNDKYGLPHPNWRENHKLALQLNARMEAMYPGLSRGVRVVDYARYNQHVHPGALLLEVGNYTDEQKAALVSADLLANVIASMLLGSEI